MDGELIAILCLLLFLAAVFVPRLVWSGIFQISLALFIGVPLAVIGAFLILVFLRGLAGY